MRVIVVTGMPGAGKEEFLAAGRATGVPFVRMGDLVREFYSGRSPVDRILSMGEFAGRERERQGADIWARRALERMRDGPNIVDGCRSMDEVRAFRGLGDTVIVAVHAPPPVRYERLVKRAREDMPHSVEEFEARDARELSWGVGEVIALSDLMIDNSGSLEDFRRRSAGLVGSLR